MWYLAGLEIWVTASLFVLCTLPFLIAAEYPTRWKRLCFRASPFVLLAAAGSGFLVVFITCFVTLIGVVAWLAGMLHARRQAKLGLETDETAESSLRRRRVQFTFAGMAVFTLILASTCVFLRDERAWSGSQLSETLLGLCIAAGLMAVATIGMATLMRSTWRWYSRLLAGVVGVLCAYPAIGIALEMSIFPDPLGLAVWLAFAGLFAVAWPVLSRPADTVAHRALHTLVAILTIGPGFWFVGRTIAARIESLTFKDEEIAAELALPNPGQLSPSWPPAAKLE